MLALVALLLSLVASGPRASWSYESARCTYAEDDVARRRIAAVGVTLVGTPWGEHLLVTLSAIDPAVEAALGWDGIAGANAVTARELARLVDEDRLQVIVDGRTCGRDRARIEVLRRAPVPLRRFDAQRGHFVESATSAELPVVLGVAVGPLDRNAQATCFVVDGRPRLTIAHAQGTIRSIESSGGGLH